MTPPIPPSPYSTEAGPRNTSMRSTDHVSNGNVTVPAPGNMRTPSYRVVTDSRAAEAAHRHRRTAVARCGIGREPGGSRHGLRDARVALFLDLSAADCLDAGWRIETREAQPATRSNRRTEIFYCGAVARRGVDTHGRQGAIVGVCRGWLTALRICGGGTIGPCRQRVKQPCARKRAHTQATSSRPVAPYGRKRS